MGGTKWHTFMGSGFFVLGGRAQEELRSGLPTMSSSRSEDEVKTGIRMISWCPMGWQSHDCDMGH